MPCMVGLQRVRQNRIVDRYTYTLQLVMDSVSFRDNYRNGIFRSMFRDFILFKGNCGKVRKVFLVLVFSYVTTLSRCSYFESG